MGNSNRKLAAKQPENNSADTTVYGEVISGQEPLETDGNRGIHAEDEYSYFNIKKLMSDERLDKKKKAEYDKILKEHKIHIVNCSTGYLGDETYTPAAEFVFEGEEEAYDEIKKIHISVTITKDKLLGVNCDCVNCRTSRYTWMVEPCPYESAVLQFVVDYVSEYNIMDATDLTGSKIMKSFDDRKRSQCITESRQQEGALVIEPRIIPKGSNICLTFKVGFDKMFVIKNLEHFAELVHNSDTEVYGTSTNINHGIQNFTAESKKWVHFIQDCVAEENYAKKLAAKGWRKYYSSVSDITLRGWRIDKLYELTEHTGVNYEDRFKKKKCMLRCETKNPAIAMNIQPIMEDKKFQGVNVQMNVPDIYTGSGNMYYIDENRDMFYKVTEDFYENMGTLFTEFEKDHGIISMNIGRTKLSEFYYGVLPDISSYVDVAETKPDIIEQYLLPETRFSFYLDAADDYVTCKVMSEYGNRKCSCLDLFRKDKVLESFRVELKERQMLYFLQRYFPAVDINDDFLVCNDEDKIYDIITGGVEELARYGAVYCTTRFKSINKAKKTSLSVGVSISSGMLELDLLADDITESELLELLKNYKKHNRYYRFKSGEFVDLQDASLQMLFEMMESMHMTPKEFVKGKMHLPLYRALYIDKLLEEHSEVYNTRDQRFRSIIKNMKSVTDADFEIPASLDTVMRNYQKNGFRWMKTLDNAGFGGILADDMGLGKTLQMISVLLSAKENGANGTSIIIAPASLVYNWGEELERFAPSLNVNILAGKAEERAAMIADCDKVDVLVTSYDILKRDIDQYEGKEFLYEVIDEAQYIKNHTTAASKAVKLINSRKRFALTGTPIENRLSELWSIFDYLMPGFLYTYDTFRKDYENPIVKSDDKNVAERLQKMVKPFIMRRLKKDVLKDLPDKLEESRVVRLDGEQRRLYDAQVVNMKNELNSGSDEDFRKDKLRILAEITKLRQICCDPNLCFDNYNGESAKLESCLELIDSAIEGDHKILLFSQFTSMLSIIENELAKKDIAYYKITGDTPKQERVNKVKQFNEDNTPVFLISLKAGGVGLNLTGADVVIHYDPWWNIAVQNQATDRAHRIGQTKKVTVYKMIAKGTIEEKIVKLQETKKNLADNIINGDNIGIASMSREDIMELLGV